jgi:sterol desaturase/sphingolipid hydroxylase (fatty acid hydroxylase superfamily)
MKHRGALGALGAMSVGVAVGVLFVAERVRPLRRPKDSTPTRVPRNAVIGLLAERRRLGLLRMLPLPRALRAGLGFLLLDYSLYVWHRLNHRSRFLWRFHSVHHIDLDLDSTTGVRFHFGELTLAAGFRAAQILLIGVDRETLRLWQRALLASVVFHHSNLSLPAGMDRRLQSVIVTPRMHGIHHSRLPREMNTNFSSLLSLWDRLHGSSSRDVPQETITIGVEGFLKPDDVTLERSLTLPFRHDARLIGAVD